MNRLALRSVSAIAGVLVALGAPLSAATAIVPGDVSDFSFESFDGQYFLDTDSNGFATTRVVETIIARFPDYDQNRGIIRAIPLRDGEVPLELSMTSISDGDGNSVYYERNDYDGFAEFALGTDEFVQGRTTYVLEYTMKNTVRHYSDSGGDEFYWDINGNGWAQAFDVVSATITLSESLAAATTGSYSCYLGYYGETGTCDLDVSDATTEFSVSVGPVGPYNTLTVAIGFDGETVVQPPLPRDSWVIQIAPKILLALAMMLVVIAGVIRTLVWRDARGRGTIIAQFEPPAGQNIYLDANLIGRESSAVAAQFVDCAVNGMINIIDEKPGVPAGQDRNRFALEFVSGDDASARELGILHTLFGKNPSAGEQVNPGALSARSGAALYALPAAAAALAIADRYRALPSTRPARVLARIGLVVVLSFVPIWVWAVIFDVLDGSVLIPAFVTVAAVVTASVILVRPALLTSEGAQAKEYLLGLREYLTIAEEDRLRVLQSPEGALRVNSADRDAVVKLNERLLPYAVLWGVESQWAEVLKVSYGDAAPAWFTGADFGADSLRSFSFASSASIRPIVTSSSSGGGSWSSSGGSSFSSGSSGGGFSGGGGGGGGGGGR